VETVYAIPCEFCFASSQGTAQHLQFYAEAIDIVKGKHYCALTVAIVPVVYEKDVIGSHGSIPGQLMWDLWWTKWHWGRLSPST
jgi:hypothetical protein